ncbi:MAG: restriction endonuclease subunit S [Candidatus Methanomethylicaceae archaeon]
MSASEGPYKLPEGWRWVRLGEVCKVLQGRTPPKNAYTSEPTAIKVLKFRDITPDGVIVWDNKERGFVYSDAKWRYAALGDVLVTASAHTPEQIGKKVAMVAHIPVKYSRVAVTGELMIFRALPNLLDSRWLQYWLTSEDGYKQLQFHVKEKHLVQSRAINILIPLPPLSEQRRIVARIEELMERIREARRLREEARQDTERLWQAVLAETFPRPGSELPEGWRWVKLGKVCETKMGGTPSTKVAEYWEPPEIVWVTPEDLEKSELNRVFSSRRLISRIGLERSSAKLFPPKTVLLSTTATIGKVAIAEKPLSANQQITGIICGDNVDPQFLAYYLIKLGETGLKQFGGTATATHINQTKLRSFSLPLPPLSEQRRIVAYLEAVHERIHSLKEGQAATDAEFRQLELTISEKAFRGEL